LLSNRAFPNFFSVSSDFRSGIRAVEIVFASVRIRTAKKGSIRRPNPDSKKKAVSGVRIRTAKKGEIQVSESGQQKKGSIRCPNPDSKKRAVSGVRIRTAKKGQYQVSVSGQQKKGRFRCPHPDRQSIKNATHLLSGAWCCIIQINFVKLKQELA
jgi:hypothetical protein